MSTGSTARGQQLLLVATVLILTANLRPAITVVGPLIDTIGEDTGTGALLLGVLGALPVVTLGIVSPMVHLLARRWGMHRCLLAAMIVLAAGTAVRSLPVLLTDLSGSAPAAETGHVTTAELLGLYGGTVIIGAAIAVGNVLVPAVVKRDFPARVSRMTGLYTATLVACASIASGAAVPLAGAVGWDVALLLTGAWAVIGAVVWSWRGRIPQHGVSAHSAPPRRQQRDSSEDRGRAQQRDRPQMWRSAVAWQVTVFFGLQSSVFYFMLTWFVSILLQEGVPARTAGWTLAGYQAVGVLGSLLVGFWMQRAADQRGVVVAVGAAMTPALLGLALVPSLYPLWTLCGGLASGTALMLALSLVGLRSRDAIDAARLSGMAQGVGYTLAALGPVLAGGLYAASGSWTVVLLSFAAVAVLQTAVGLPAGRAVIIRPVMR